MRQRNQTLGYVVLLAGLALIFSGFFLFVPPSKRSDVFWLDLSVVCLVFLANYLTEFGLFGFYVDFEKQVAGLGIRLAYMHLYTILALAAILIGWYAQIQFRYQLFFQLLGVFVLLVGYFLSQLSSGKAISVQAEQDMNRKGKDEILKAISQFEILFTGDSTKWAAEKQKIDFLKEGVRYLSPSNNQSAADLDSEIASAIQQAYTVAKNTNEGGVEIFSRLNKCEELLKLRKTTYSN